MAEYLLGIDIGTSACKAAVFDLEGNVKATASGDYPVYYPHLGWAEQNPEDWYQGVCNALKKIWEAGVVRPEEIEGIGIDGQSWSAVALGKDGRSLTNTPIWMDTRSQGICTKLNERIGAERIFQLAGNWLRPTYTTSKVLWYRENVPEVFDKTAKILQSNGYVGYRLTGEITEDVCTAYGWHCFNMRTGKWDMEMAQEMEIPADFLPEIVRCDQVIGKVTAAAALETGLPEGIPVIAGGLDAACGTLGTGAIHNGETQEQGGQAGGMSICLDQYKADPSLILSFHVVPNVWLLQGGTTGGGGALKWLRETMCPELSFEEMSALAETAQPGSGGVTFLPYMAGERSPIWNPDACGVFFGLNFGINRAQMIRACMEGVAYALRHNLETAAEAGARAGVLRAMGGSANSRIWTQIKADVTGCRIEVPASDTATTLGAAILAGVGTGVYGSFEEAAERTVSVKMTYAPDPEMRAVYDKGYETYRKLYPALEEIMNAQA